MTESELSYIAGFFDGEGSASFVWRRSKKNGKRYGKLEVKVAQNQVEVLNWICASFGFGRVYTGKPAAIGKKPVSHLVMLCENARRFLSALRPYLRVKAARVDEVLALDAVHCRRRSIEHLGVA